MIALFIDCLPRGLDLFWISVNLCSGGVEKAPVSTKSQKNLSLSAEWVSVGFLILFVMLEYVESRIS